jgi:hypothetical protein
MNSNELVKLDVDMLKTLNVDEQMVVKGGIAIIPYVIIIVAVTIATLGMRNPLGNPFLL